MKNHILTKFHSYFKKNVTEWNIKLFIYMRMIFLEIHFYWFSKISSVSTQTHGIISCTLIALCFNVRITWAIQMSRREPAISNCFASQIRTAFRMTSWSWNAGCDAIRLPESPGWRMACRCREAVGTNRANWRTGCAVWLSAVLTPPATVGSTLVSQGTTCGANRYPQPSSSQVQRTSVFMKLGGSKH